MAKVAALFNLVWRGATCDCCRRWAVDDYLPAGSYRPAVAVIERRERDRVLQESAAGEAKARGKRNPSVTDQQRERVSKDLLLGPRTAVELQRCSRLSTLWVLQFALEARGETVRGLTWSDFAVHTFGGMFAANGKGLGVLCAYISATKTTEGAARCIGALPHVNPWLCPFGALADALVATFHRPGGDTTRSPVDFAPLFSPDDEALVAAGVTPAHFREAGRQTGFRRWYRVLVVPSATGGPLKRMSYQYHNTHLKHVMMASGIPDWAAKTHLSRRAAAQQGKERGAAEADNMDHGQWSKGVGGGSYEHPVPNKNMALSLSGRPIDCAAPTTPRLTVAVPAALQGTLCPWLEAEEAAYTRRVSADSAAQDEALKDFFSLVRLLRCVFFQTWAARLATASSPPDAAVLVHPLLNSDAFRTLCTTMRGALESAGECAAGAIEQVLPQLASAVSAAVESVAAGSAAEVQDLERSLSMQLDVNVERLEARTAAGVEEVKTHGNALLSDVRRLVVAEAGRTRELLVRLLSAHEHQDAGTRAWLDAELQRPEGEVDDPAPARIALGGAALGPPGAGGAATVPVATAGPSPRQPSLTQRLVADRRFVRSLQVRGKLAGVRVHDNGEQCVPLLPMAPNLGWEQALDEYAVGLDGRASIVEVQQLFGSRWRLGHDDVRERNRLIKLYSERAALYRAFDLEYADRGKAVGIAGVVSFLKQRYATTGNSKAVLARLRKDYPARPEKQAGEATAAT